MTDDKSLREQLARWLWDVACEADPHPNVGSLEWGDEVGAAVAAECLRQMEWARRQGAESKFRDSDYGGTIAEMPPLILAPPEWKP